MSPTRHRWRRWAGGIAAGVLATVLAGLATAPPATAQLDPCDDVVIDLSDQVDLDAVEAEVDALDERATVRVRVFEFSDGGDLDRSVNRLLATCPEWSDGPGGRRWDLVVLAVSLRERQTSLYYGCLVRRAGSTVGADHRRGDESLLQGW